MSLASRIRRLPAILDPRRVAGCAAHLPGGIDPGLRDLVAAAAALSPHLAELAGREGDWLAEIGAQEPEAVLAGLLCPPPPGDTADLDRALRRAKGRIALLTALADLGGVWDLAAVTGALTGFADMAVGAALDHHLAGAVARGLLPTGAQSGGMFVLAMGKMGAGELNYSSDIDLICLFDESRYPPGDYADIRAGFVRVTQRIVKTLSARTAEGYVLRTDLRLRPDPSVTPVCIGAGQAEAYYESLGRTWERAAMIKARPCAGDLDAGAAFLAGIRPFVWRRHLDFAAIEDVHDMQRRIREHKGRFGTGEIPGHDVKLGRGGIRMIEFFAQTRQLICGGRDPDLRLRGTVPALGALAAKGWIAEEVAEALAGAYAAHRALEHRIQMLEDAQTHQIPKAEAARARLAALSGQADLAAFEAAARARFDRVQALTEAFFSPGGTQPRPAISLARLEALGYTRAEAVLAQIAVWQAGRIPATRSDRARAILARILPEILERLAGAASPDDAMARFDALLSGLPAGVQILSLFEANPQLLDLIAEICAASPRLASLLAQHSRVLDSVLDRSFFAPLPGVAALRAGLGAHLDAAGDYERVLDAARVWNREQEFRAGVQLLRGISTAEEAGACFTALAEATLQALLPHVTASFAARYGPPPGRGAVILGMGKLGSGEMTISSDLDLIAIYDAGGETDSAGPKRLPVSVYYARLIQALVSALSVPTAEGTLYEVDMRLRPSGRKGPVAVALAGFESYHTGGEAWTWEHLALTRARVVAGPEALAADVEAVIGAVRAAPRDRTRLLSDAREMRERLARAHLALAGALWEVKHRPGGMMDIELALQTGLLALGLTEPRAPRAGIAPLLAGGFLHEAQALSLAEALSLQAIVQQLARLALAGTFTPEAAGVGLVQALIRATGDPDLATLAARLDRLTEAAREVVTDLLGTPG